MKTKRRTLISKNQRSPKKPKGNNTIPLYKTQTPYFLCIKRKEHLYILHLQENTTRKPTITQRNVIEPLVALTPTCTHLEFSTYKNKAYVIKQNSIKTTKLLSWTGQQNSKKPPFLATKNPQTSISI